MNCRIVRNLVYDFVLGWDFFSKYECSIHPSEGVLKFENDIIKLEPSTMEISSTYFCLTEDTVVPADSKMVTQAAFYIDPHGYVPTSDTVLVEPPYGNNALVAVARTLSRVQDGRFPVEILNPYPCSMMVKANSILGQVSFTTDDHLAGSSMETEMTVEYDSGYESEGSNAPEDEAERGKSTSEKESASATLDSSTTSPKERPPPKPIIDYSNIADDAKPQLDQLKELLEVKHAKVFSTDDRDRGKTDLVEYHANIKPGPPINVKPYRATPEMQKIMDKEVHEMLADGLVSHSTSPYSAPVLLVAKKTPGQWRFVTDFRRVNARCERVVYPLPRIDDALQKLNEPKFFSTMDLQKGFWQVPIAKEDRKYFAFSTGSLHVEYNVMPMGALNSSSTMQALMALVTRGLPIENIICFLDDILVASATMEEHLEHLGLILGAIERAGLKLNSKKCLFAQASVSCLGHRLSRDGIGPDPVNLDKIRKWRPPKNRTEVRQFLGLTGYYRCMIKDYSKIACPLTNLTKKDKDWSWTDEHQKAFETLRDYLTSSTIMCYPDFSKPFWVKSDASGSSVGFVLTQMHDKKEKVVAYGSKKLTETQTRYCTYDREFFGILTAVRTYSHYLRYSHFYVITDHRPLLSLKTIDPKSDATGRRVRWSIELNLYDFEVIYKKGKRHSDADAMSRNTDHDDFAEEEEFAGFMLEGEGDLYFLMGMDDYDATTAVELIAIDESRKKLAEAQDGDPTIREVKRLVKLCQTPTSDLPLFYKKEFKRFAIKDNILFRKVIDGPSGLPVLQAIIPPSLVPEVLQDAHGHKLAGHPGHQKMVEKLQRNVIWPGIYPDCKRVVKKCHSCDRNAVQNPKPKTELQSMNPSYVFEHVCCDLITLTPSQGYNYVCVFMDVFSKHVACYKMRDKTTKSYARALEDYVTHHGCPQKLSSDNGPEFCSDLVNALTQIMGIKKRTSVVYRPQSQGNVERWNRTLIKDLRTRLDKSGDAWPDHLNYVAMAYNATPTSRTGQTPNMVFYGRELPIPTFTDFSVNTLREKTVQEYVKKAKECVRLVHDAVRSESKKRSDKVAEAYNKKAKHKPLTKGELVFYEEIPQNLNKLSIPFTGPVEVTERHRNAQGGPGTTYTLKFEGGETMKRNYEQLKRAQADYTGPISKQERPLKRAPKIPLFVGVVSSSDEEDTPAADVAPVSSRTRRGVAARVAAQAVPSSLQPLQTPALPPPTAQPSVSLATPPMAMAQNYSPTATSATPAPFVTSHFVSNTLISAQVAAPPIQAVWGNSLSPVNSFIDQTASSSGEEAANLTNVTLWNGLNSLSWDPAFEPLSSLNHNVGSEVPVSPTGDESLPGGFPQIQLDPDGLPPIHPASRNTNSHGSTPDATQNTVVQASPAQSANTGSSPEATLESSPHSSPQTSDQFHTAGTQIVSASAVADESNGSFNVSSFEEALDMAEEEIELRQNVGCRGIDVILYREYEYRRDRASEGRKMAQKWVCRYANKTKCKGKLKLNVRDLNNFIDGAIISDLCDHNHEPYNRVNNLGLAEVTEIKTDESEVEGAAADDAPTGNISSDGTFSNSEGDSSSTSAQCIAEEDPSFQFDGSLRETRAHSSPVASRHQMTLNLSDVSTPLTTPDSWQCVGVSQTDDLAFAGIMHVRRRRRDDDQNPAEDP